MTKRYICISKQIGKSIWNWGLIITHVSTVKVTIMSFITSHNPAYEYPCVINISPVKYKLKFVLCEKPDPIRWLFCVQQNNPKATSGRLFQSEHRSPLKLRKLDNLSCYTINDFTKLWEKNEFIQVAIEIYIDFNNFE